MIYTCECIFKIIIVHFWNKRQFFSTHDWILKSQTENFVLFTPQSTLTVCLISIKLIIMKTPHEANIYRHNFRLDCKRIFPNLTATRLPITENIFVNKSMSGETAQAQVFEYSFDYHWISLDLKKKTQTHTVTLHPRIALHEISLLPHRYPMMEIKFVVFWAFTFNYLLIDWSSRDGAGAVDMMKVWYTNEVIGNR